MQEVSFTLLIGLVLMVAFLIVFLILLSIQSNTKKTRAYCLLQVKILLKLARKEGIEIDADEILRKMEGA